MAPSAKKKFLFLAIPQGKSYWVGKVYGIGDFDNVRRVGRSVDQFGKKIRVYSHSSDYGVDTPGGGRRSAFCAEFL